MPFMKTRNARFGELNEPLKMAQVICRDGRRFDFDPDRTALLVVDMQRDFVAPDGYVMNKHGPSAELTAIVPKLTRVLRAARRAGLSIIHTREGYGENGADINSYKKSLGYVGRPGPNGPFLIRGTAGHDFLEGFEPLTNEMVIDKAGFSAFYKTGLRNSLAEQKITHLTIAGVTTQCCVHSTLRDAVDRGFFCLTLEDCCAAEDAAVHRATLRIIQAENNLFGWIATAQAYIDAIQTMRDIRDE